MAYMVIVYDSDSNSIFIDKADTYEEAKAIEESDEYDYPNYCCSLIVEAEDYI